MPGLPKSISCNGRAGSCDLLAESGHSEEQAEAERVQKYSAMKDQQSPSDKALATLFVRKRLDLARQASPIMSHQSSPTEAVDPDTDKPQHLETFIKSLSVFSVSSLLLVLSSLLLMCAFISCSSRNRSTLPFHIKDTTGNRQRLLDVNATRSGDMAGILAGTYKVLLAEAYDQDLLGDDIADVTSDHGGDKDGVDGFKTAGVALTAYVVAASLVCFLVCSMQCYFVSKVLDLADGYDRAYKYICVCSRSRSLAVTGLFTSIPVFITGVVVFLLSQVSSAHFTTGVIFCVLGGAICIVCALHNCYHWRLEKTRADQGLPVYDSHFSIPRNALIRGSPKRQKELCTMV